jgi:N-acetylmuramoyl-L-alanine amidase
MLARQVAAQLRARGIEVVLTRDGDYEMPLAARTAMANKIHADVFLSIHLNSMHSGLKMNPALAEGVETYILNHETDSTSKRLAQLENQVMGGGADQQGDVALILKDLRLDASLPESKRLACMIQEHVVAIDPKAHLKKGVSVTSNRGVRQALFFVLLGADMPSALVEAGFLSNAHDRDWLLSLNGQKAFGLAVARAINLFRMQKNTPIAQKTLSTCKVH